MPPTALALLLFPFTVIAAALRRSAPPRVIHLGDMALWPLGLLVLVWPETALVISAHGTDVAYHRRGGVKGRLYGAYLRTGARLLGGRMTVIANSRATRDVTAETGWRRIAVVPLASDFADTGATQAAPSTTILFAGRLVKRKGLSWFVREVLPLLPDSLTLDVAGTVWDASEEAALADPRVRFLGPLPQDELARRFAAALCVIVPNIAPENGEYEGFGLVAPEAAAAVVPGSGVGDVASVTPTCAVTVCVPAAAAAAATGAGAGTLQRAVSTTGLIAGGADAAKAAAGGGGGAPLLLDNASLRRH